MTDRPILFSAPMVRALLDGRKTQTRRIIKPHGRNSLFDPGEWADSYVLDPGNAQWRARDVRYGVGDRLWVKETWRAGRGYDGAPPRDVAPWSRLWFEADGCNDNADMIGRKARPSIFMPRWASRLTLIVTDVRVQRLQDCSEIDAIAEGVEKVWSIVDVNCNGGVHSEHSDWRYFVEGVDLGDEGFEDALSAYAALWDHINGDGAWDANPWVVAISFEVWRQNIDAEAPHG